MRLATPTFTAVLVSHANESGLRHMLGVLRYQTRPPDETIVLVSGLDTRRLEEEFPEGEFRQEPDLHDWGHEKRAKGLELARCEYLGFFNDDDTYERTYLEKMLTAVRGGADAAYCGWTGEHGNPDPRFAMGSSTSGNFIVRTALARQLGWNERVYEADGLFINRVAGSERIVFVPETLYHHDGGLRDGEVRPGDAVRLRGVD